MAKAKLTSVAQKWVSGKTAKRQTAKSRQDGKAAKRFIINRPAKHTVYISREASKRLWMRRAHTGAPISHTVDQLIMKHLPKA